MPTPTMKKPLLLFTAFPAAGHTTPLLQIAEYMVNRGYEAIFVSSKEYEPKIRRLRAGFVDTLGMKRDFPPEPLDAFRKVVLQEPDANEEGNTPIAEVERLLSQVPQRTQVMHETLERLRERHPQRQIIIVQEVFSMSVYPFWFGRPLPKGFDEFPKTISVNIIPLFTRSADTAPFFLGLPPNSSESGRQRNKELHQGLLDGQWKAIGELQNKYLIEAGATTLPASDTIPLDALLSHTDACLQMCSLELEYPRSDLPKRIKFAGCLPIKPIPADYQYPGWWREVTQNAGAKKIVFVAQGTVSINWNDLIIPTLKALDGRDDLIVIATLGVRGASLPDTFKLPSNARVDPYLLYDAVLQYADVFVCNSAYGSMTHAIANGVPQVLAGETQDKREVGARVAWAGFGYNTGTQFPTPEQIREGVDRVLGDPRYKRRAMELMKGNEEMDALGRIERQIQEFTQ